MKKKQVTRITENQLNQIVKESVKTVLNEGLGNKLRGAINGFRQGDESLRQNGNESDDLRYWLTLAMKALSTNNPQSCVNMLQKFVKNYEQKWGAEHMPYPPYYNNKG